MKNVNRQVEFNLEAKLAGLNMTPAQRTESLEAARKAELVIAAIVWLGATLKRLISAMTLKPSLRA